MQPYVKTKTKNTTPNQTKTKNLQNYNNTSYQLQPNPVQKIKRYKIRGHHLQQPFIIIQLKSSYCIFTARLKKTHDTVGFESVLHLNASPEINKEGLNNLS